MTYYSVNPARMTAAIVLGRLSKIDGIAAVLKSVYNLGRLKLHDHEN
jgi:hypothetical protein